MSTTIEIDRKKIANKSKYVGGKIMENGMITQKVEIRIP